MKVKTMKFKSLTAKFAALLCACGFAFSAWADVAQIGNNTYPTLEAAVAAVPTDGTATIIEMVADESSSSTVTFPAGVNVTLTGNGYNVGSIVNNGTLRLYKAIIAVKITNNATLSQNSSSHLTGDLENATSNSSFTGGSNSPITGNIVNRGTFTLGQAGIIIQGNVENYSTMTIQSSGTGAINGNIVNSGSLTINYTSIQGGIVNYGNLTVSKSKKTIDGDIDNYGHVEITTSTQAKNETAITGTITVRHGAYLMVTGPINAYTVSAPVEPTTTWAYNSVGTENFRITEYDDTGVVVNYVAQSPYGRYDTFKAAWDDVMAHNVGQSITLLDDASVNDVLSDTGFTQGDIFIVLNGHTLTVNAGGGFGFANNNCWISGAGTIVINGDNLADRFSIGENGKLTIVKGNVNAELGSDTSLLDVLNLVYASGYAITDDSTNVYVQRASNVPAIVHVDSIALDKTEMTLAIGETNTLTATISPANATEQFIVWSAGDINIASIETPIAAADIATIKVIGQSTGTAYISARPLDWGEENPENYVCCTVTVASSVAQIGDVKYASLKDAIMAAADGATIEILDGTWGADGVGTMTIPEALSVRAKSLMIQAADGALPTFTSNVKLGYDDSSTRNATITVKGLAFNGASLDIGNYTQTTVEDCSFTDGTLRIVESCASNYNRTDFVLDQVTVRNCTFDSTASGDPAIRVRNSGNLLIEGNEIANSAHNGILLESNGTVNTQVAKTIVIQNNTIIEWNVGNVNGGGRGIRAALGTPAAGTTVTITGNVFRKGTTGLGLDTPDFVKITEAGSATVELSGNDWNDMLLSEVAGNTALYTCSVTPTLTSVITTKSEPVAQIGNVKYASLAAAVVAAQDGDTIELIADDRVSLTDGQEVEINKTLTIIGALDEDNEPLYTIYGTKTKTGTNDIFITGSGTVTLQNLKVAEFGCDKASDSGHAPIYVSTYFTGTVNIGNVYVSKFNRGGIFLNGGEFNVTGCYIDCANSRSGAFTKGIEIKGAATGTIADTVIMNMERHINSGADATAGIEIYGSGSIIVDGCTIVSDDGNHEAQKATYGIVSSRVGVHDPSGGSLLVRDCLFSTSNGAVSISDNDNYGPVNGYSMTLVDNSFDNYIGLWSAASSLTIESGDYAEDVYVDAGAVTITGGAFANFVPTTGEGGTISISGGQFDAEVPEEYLAEGYVCVGPDSDDIYIVIPATYVAKIGSTEYLTLDEALAAAQDGDTVELIADADLREYEYEEYHNLNVSGITLDLGGHDIKILNAGVAFVGENSVIMNGTMTSYVPSTGAIGGAYACFIGDDGVVTSNMLITNVTMTGGVNVYNASGIVLADLVVEGTTYYAVWADSAAEVTVKSGDYSSTSTEANSVLAADYEESIMNVEGGNFTIGNGQNVVLLSTVEGAIAISGGWFTAPVPVKYCAEGYKPVYDEAKALYTVIPCEYVAQIGEAKYESLQAALNAVQNDETIVILDDITETVYATSQYAYTEYTDKSFTIDFNGKTVTTAASPVPSRTVFNFVNKGSAARTVTLINGTITSLSGTYNCVRTQGVESEDSKGLSDADAPAEQTINIHGMTLNNNQGYGVAIKPYRNTTVDLENTVINSDIGGNVDVQKDSKVVIHNGKFTQTSGDGATGDTDTCRVNVSVSYGGVAEIRGGTFTSSKYGFEVCSSGGTITISDATATAGGYVLRTTGGAGKIEVSDGKFFGTYASDDGDIIAISGGYFDRVVPANYIVEGKLCTTKANYDHLYQVVPAKTVTFHLGTEAPAGASEPAQMKYPTGDPAETALPLPTYTSSTSTFVGWKDAQNNTWAKIPAGTDKDLVLTATWESARVVEVTVEEKTPTVKVTDSWIVQNVDGATTETVAQVANETVKTELQKTDTNGLQKWQNYVLGQDTTKSAAVVAAKDSAEPTVAELDMTFDVPAIDTGFDVTYRLDEVDAAGETVTEGAKESVAEIDLEAATTSQASAYFQVKAVLTPKGEGGTEKAVEVNVEKTVGVVKVDSAAEWTIVAVPWESLGTGAIKASELIHLGNRSNGDELRVYTAGAYQTWKLQDGNWVEPTRSFKATKSGSQENSVAGASDVSIPRGAGVWLKRVDPTAPIYLLGQKPTTAAVATTLDKPAEGKQTWNLVAPPSVNPVNIADLLKDTEATDKVLVPTASVPKNIVKMFDKWGYIAYETNESGITYPVFVEQATLPAGTGFWYLNGDSNTDNKKLNW